MALRKDENTTRAFECPVCFEVFHKPVRIQSCHHIFCADCLVKSIQQRRTCPVCRERIADRTEAATDVVRQMKDTIGKCRECEQQISFSKMRTHLSFQHGYEYPSRPPVSDYLPEAREDDALDTYACPYCQEGHFTVEELTSHCNQCHSDDNRSMVCPICSSMPWGDVQYASRNFLAHLNLRHNFEYFIYVGSEYEEEAQLQSAILRSHQGSEYEEEAQLQSAILRSLNEHPRL
ncbi:RING finger protein 166-like [Rhinatrema bivittatum]|uniref:RING finger protein 166-like n=1 Tax=Rhinatrema bivittatum TaxID=194408 RepID=UPI00112844D5|nr:RING finger protein 166-like [Rhinatrema bivittatum]